MKIVLVAVKYSSNVGDGVIAECLEKILPLHIANASVTSVDLSGKAGYGSHGVSRRAPAAVGILQKMPGALRSLSTVLLNWTISSVLLRKRWEHLLADADVIILGGGQLFQDTDFYFPPRVRTALDIVSRSGKPVYIYAVGVSKSISPVSRHFFKQGLRHAKVRGTWVRDSASQRNFERILGSVDGVFRDPGLLAAAVFPTSSSPEKPKARRRLGICLTNPGALNQEGQRQGGGVWPDRQFYVDLISEACTQDIDCALLTAGSEGDHSFACELVEQLRLAPRSRNVRLMPRPVTPSDMVRQISAVDCLISQRMHPNIVAYSLGIPSIGLQWDHKLESFFRSVERERFLVKADALTSGQVLKLADDAVTEGIDEGRHSAVIEETMRGIETLAAAIMANAHQSTSRLATDRLARENIETSIGT